MSDLRPRPPPPVPSGPGLSARVEPQVPAPSLYNPALRPAPLRHASHPRPPPVERPVAPLCAPQATAQPPSYLLKPSSDFSRIFHSSEATLFLNGSEAGPGGGRPAIEIVQRHIQVRDEKVPQSPVRPRPPLMEAVTPLPATAKASHTPDSQSPGLVEVLARQNSHLAWQNQQLLKLGEQVAALLANSSPQAPSGVSADSPHTSPTAPLRREQACSPLLQRKPASANMATNTSTLWDDIQQAMDRLKVQQEEHRSGEAGEDSSLCVEDLTSVQGPPLSLPCSPPPSKPSLSSWSSPVLGESLSMYQEQEQQQATQEHYRNLMDQVRNLLAQDLPGDTRQREAVDTVKVGAPFNQRKQLSPDEQPVRVSRGIPAVSGANPVSDEEVQYRYRNQYIQMHNQNKEAHVLHPGDGESQPDPLRMPPTHQPPAVHQLDPRTPEQKPANRDPVASTVERLRQMGVSFITPQDLSPKQDAIEPAGVSPVGEGGQGLPSLFLPEARLPSILKGGGYSQEVSLDINSLALKYLDDGELGHLAERLGNKKQVSWGQHRERERGQADYSIATQQFLARHGLTPQAPHSGNNILEGIPRQPLPAARHAPHLPQREEFPFPASHDRVLPFQHPALGPGPSTRPPHQPTINQQLAANMPATRENRVLDITAIKQQPKLL